MARIRSLRPEFCTSESIAGPDGLSIPCRLHFAMLWTYADDAGRGLDNARLIKAAVWPLDDDVTLEHIEAWQAELATAGRVVRYEAGGKRYFEVVNFGEHQRPNRPVPSKLPAPSEGEQVQGSESAVCAHEHLTPVVVDVGVDVDGEVGENSQPSVTEQGDAAQPRPAGSCRDPFTVAAELLADAELERRLEAGDQIRNPEGYRRSRILPLRDEHAPVWQQLTDDDPDVTPAELVAFVAPRARPTPAPQPEQPRPHPAPYTAGATFTGTPMPAELTSAARRAVSDSNGAEP